MSHVPKRLASTATKVATLSTSHLKVFPPPEAVVGRAPSSSQTERTPSFFSAETWATLQPPNPASLSAFAHRIGLAKTFSNPAEVIQQACTHPSFVPFHAKHNPDQPAVTANGNLTTLGNSLLGLFATEHVNSTYPHLPTRVMKAAVSAYVGASSCASIAKDMGVGHLLRWNRTPNTPTRPAVLHADAMSSVPRALTALIYQHQSLAAARTFAHKFFLSREINLRNMIKFRDPKLALQETVAKFGRERPVSRLLRETGRLSNSPIFVVGIYTGGDQLGEGFGSSLRMAEYRAAEDALLRLYLTRQPSHLVQLPTSTFGDARGDIFSATTSPSPYTPVEMQDTEILYGSADKSGTRNPGARSTGTLPEDEVD
ncbi:hypothetical protein PHLGIDRAFT_85700 [Phlebiopsis gigantea 11061_1 CR5-6]|uniref:Large ribosomal subunit protein mL44 n=1 Tax=Phlebiopsis gigantea (strain 11061_1 CR5-6) TaxID=745531 RepID=A0A0C3SDW6_PHLG1|nr:hypothetical protein PHLGIDRAFT_85700 [Phlebiopsis gigantea 11061_1 CR5-6]